MEFLRWWSGLSSDGAFGVGLLLFSFAFVIGVLGVRFLITLERIFGRSKKK